MLLRQGLFERLQKAPLNVLWYGGTLVLAEHIILGTLMAFLLIAGTLYPRIASVSSVVLSFQDVRASLCRFLDYYQVQPAVSELPGTH